MREKRVNWVTTKAKKTSKKAFNITNLQKNMSWQVFNKLYLKYDEWFDTFPGERIFELEVRCAREAFQEIPKPWLEVGVGTGRFAEKLAIDFGVDPSGEMLKVASKRGIKTAEAVGERLPFPSSLFGGVALIVTLCFLDDPLKVLKECFYVLKSGGGIVLGIVPRESTWGKFYLKKKKEGHLFYSVAHFYTIQESINLLEKTGFEVETVFSTLFEKPAECRGIRPYPPRPERTEKAGFVCIKARKS